MTNFNYETTSVWGGEGKVYYDRSTQVPVFHSISFGYTNMDEWHDVALGKAPGHIYSRNTNPTVDQFEAKVRDLEQAESATSFSSGMAAISNTLLTLLSPGMRVVTVKDTYGGTNKVFNDILPRMNIDVALCDTTNHEEIEGEIDQGCDLLYLETPTNPTLKLIDISRLASYAKKSQNSIVVVDNTFATPINQSPLKLGADLTIHSASKFLGGHADALGGVICGNPELVHRIFHYREITGATLDPMSAYLLLRGLKTLALRIERQNQSAQKVAEYLSTHPKVEAVFYPGLTTHPQHELAKRQMRGFGGMLSFSVKGGFDSVKTCLTELKHAHRAANLGAVETIVGPPRTASHVELSAKERARAGIPENLIRYSTGIESVDDLIADLEQALAKVEIKEKALA